MTLKNIPVPVDITDIKSFRPEDNQLNEEQWNIIEKALKTKKETYVFELKHNNGQKSTYEVSIETIIINNEYYYVPNINPTLLDQTSTKMNPKYHDFLKGNNDYCGLINLILARFIIAQENYIEYDL